MMYAFLSLFQRIMDLIICQSVNIGQHVTVSSGGKENEIFVNAAYFSVELLLVSLLLLLYLPGCDDLWDQSGEVVLHCFSYKYELKVVYAYMSDISVRNHTSDLLQLLQ